MSMAQHDAERPETHPVWPSEMIDQYRRGQVSRTHLMEYLRSYPYVDREPTDDPAYTLCHPGEFGAVAFGLTLEEYAELFALMHSEHSATPPA